MMAPALGGKVFAGMVHEDSAHQLRSDAEEVQAVFPMHGGMTGQTQVSFMDEGGPLQGVTGALTGKTLARQSPKLVINKRDEHFPGSSVAAAPAKEQFRYLTG
jgi:hypothetical protein